MLIKQYTNRLYSEKEYSWFKNNSRFVPRKLCSCFDVTDPESEIGQNGSDAESQSSNLHRIPTLLNALLLSEILSDLQAHRCSGFSKFAVPGVKQTIGTQVL